MRIVRLDVQNTELFGEPIDGLIRAILRTTATEADRAFEDEFITGCYALYYSSRFTVSSGSAALREWHSGGRGHDE
jgi:hypothetical protein